jgi:hypothetical protein
MEWTGNYQGTNESPEATLTGDADSDLKTTEEKDA